MGNQSAFGQQTHAIAAQPLGSVEPPALLHPGAAGLSAYAEGTAPAGLQTAAQWLQEARDTWGQINQVRTVADPALTEDSHVLRVNQVAERGVEKMVRGFDRARAALATAEAGYESEIAAATRLTPTVHAGEIRSIVRAMPVQERYSTLISAMDNGDSATLAAVLSAPGITSGLTDAQVDNLRSMYQRRAAPEALANLQAVRRTREKTVQAFDQLLEGSDNLALRQRAGLVKERQRKAQDAARLAEAEGYATDRWTL